jgi:hypothetical protein
LSGTISVTIEGSGLGILKDVTLAKSTHIQGGTLSGKIMGDAESNTISSGSIGTLHIPTKVVNSCFGNGTQWISRNSLLALISGNSKDNERNNCQLLLKGAVPLDTYQSFFQRRQLPKEKYNEQNYSRE